jgi:hypothetical protein
MCLHLNMIPRTCNRSNLQVTGCVCVTNISRPTHKLDYYPSNILRDLVKGPH